MSLFTLSSDHLPILIILQMRTTTIPGLRRTYVNLKKANWERYRLELEAALGKRSLPTGCQRDERSSVQFYSKQRHTTSLLDDTHSMRNLYQQRYWMWWQNEMTSVKDTPTRVNYQDWILTSRTASMHTKSKNWEIFFVDTLDQLWREQLKELIAEQNVRHRTKQLPSMEAGSQRPSSLLLGSTNSSTRQN